jgi:hypothetical protein
MPKMNLYRLIFRHISQASIPAFLLVLAFLVDVLSLVQTSMIRGQPREDTSWQAGNSRCGIEQSLKPESLRGTRSGFLFC